MPGSPQLRSAIRKLLFILVTLASDGRRAGEVARKTRQSHLACEAVYYVPVMGWGNPTKCDWMRGTFRSQIWIVLAQPKELTPFSNKELI